MKIKKFKKRIEIIESASVAGKLEKEGPLGSKFDITAIDTKFGEDSWEIAESEMTNISVGTLLDKAKVNSSDIDIAFGGDLINQCTSTSSGIKDYNIPFAGLYGACSTFVLSLGMAAVSIESDLASKAICVTSSHFCSAERQFRFPIEYGSQRTPTAQNTVTGSGCVLLSDSQSNSPYISEFLPGKIIDFNINDANNMGAAMAPAFADTLTRYFEISKMNPQDFDMILSGDLGKEGKQISIELLKNKGIDISDNYKDCGCMIYDFEKQDVHCGGSGCACSALVFSGHILEELRNRRLKNILFIGTGALLNSASVLQKQSIPGIAHLVRIEI